MASKSAKQLAFEAGRNAYLTEPPDRRSVDGCPFEPGTDERTAWLNGFSDALESTPSDDDLRKALKEAK